MRFGSVCSGIEAASVAWLPLGWECAWVSEIDPFACAVLGHRHPEAPNLGDMTTIVKEGKLNGRPAIDLLVGGTPCQDFSVAGKRAGMDGERSGLAREFLAIASEARPRWLVWENVPGCMSTNGGRDFGAIVGAMVELGYGVAWRVLDAQYVRTRDHPRAVPQRRRRVFVVGYLGDWRPSCAVLLEPESMSGHPPPSRKAGQDAAGTLSTRATAGGGLGTDFECGGGLVADAAPTLNAHFGDKQGLEDQHALNGAGLFVPAVGYSLMANESPHGRLDFGSETFICQDSAPALTSNPYGDHEAREGLLVSHALRAEGFDASEDGTGRGTPIVAFSSKDSGADASADVAPTMRAMEHDGSHANGGGQLAVAFSGWAADMPIPTDVAPTLDVGKSDGIAVAFAENSRNEVRLVGGDGSVAPALSSGGGKPGQSYGAVAVSIRGREGGATAELHEGASPSIRASQGGGDKQHVMTVGVTGTLKANSGGGGWTNSADHAAAGFMVPNPDMTVRRITPTEAERLMALPDGYTLVPYRGKPASDGPRYRALGNSIAINVLSWIGKRIKMCEEVMKETRNTNA